MTHFSWLIDGTIIGLYLVITLTAGVFVRKYVGKVEHFLVAGREVNVYLGIASLAATEFGVVTCMYSAQLGYNHGFAGAMPGILQALAMFFVGITGFCVKPLREAGVMTIPELFEKRYGPRIRWAAGVVIVLGGLLNMGVFLRVTGEFLMLVCGFDPAWKFTGHLDLFGSALTFQVGYLEIMMTGILVIATVYTVLGGMLSVLVTDFLQFIVMSIGLLAVTGMILVYVGWDRLVESVNTHYQAGGFNPVANPALGWSWVLFNPFVNLAATLTWQTTISRLLAAKDAKTGRQIYTRTSFFFVCRFLIPAVWGIAAMAILTPQMMSILSPELQPKASLYAMPIFLSTFLPIGLMGMLVAAMLAADMSTTSSYMITWGSVIYNDVMAPFRKTKWSERRGILWNRMIVALIGVFLLVYGLWYPLSGNVWDYLAVTGTIYLASICTMLIACCYWKRANSWGAAGAIFVGAAIPLTYLALQLIPVTGDWIKANLGDKGMHYSGIAAFVSAAVAMIIGSLLKPGHNQQNVAAISTAGGE